jgi:hypothetical protein
MVKVEPMEEEKTLAQCYEAVDSKFKVFFLLTYFIVVVKA